MIYVSFILFYLAFCINLILTSRFFIHIYQYCNYNSNTYTKWLRQNLNILLPRALFCLIPPMLINVNHEVGIILAGILYIISAYLFRKPEYTKEFKITGKVKKVGIILLIFFIVVVGFSLIFFEKLVITSLILAISYICIPFIIMISSKLLKLNIM